MCITNDLIIQVGWGKSEETSHGHENVPKQAVIQVIDSYACVLKYNQIGKISSFRTFCGGADENSDRAISPCHGKGLRHHSEVG